MTREPQDPSDELDRRIDAAVRRAYEPPPLDALVARVQAGARATSGRAPRAPWPYLAAAAILLTAGGAWLASTMSRPAAVPAIGSDASDRFAAAYRDVLARQQSLSECCTIAPDPKALCGELSCGFLAFDGAEGLTLEGSLRGQDPTACAGFLVKASGEPVCVFVMPRERAPEVPRDGVLACDPAGAPSVRIHRRDVGDFALYEVNGRDAPVALPRFFAP